MFHLEHNEKVLYEARKHWFVLFFHGISLLIIAFIPFIIYYFFASFAPAGTPIELAGEVRALVFFGYLIWLLILWVIFFIGWTDYYLDIWYITDRKIIDIEQKGLFNRELTTMRYEQVQDVTVEVKGFIPTLLNYGDIHVQTAGHNREVILESASNPNSVKELILKCHAETTKNMRMSAYG